MNQLKIYYKFKQKIKAGKCDFRNSYPKYKCFIISKEDILKWKQFYEYDESLFLDDSLVKDWEIKINKKCQNKEKPTFKILSSFNEIKNN